MKTVALRFAEFITPSEGTIRAHEEDIDKIGFACGGNNEL